MKKKEKRMHRSMSLAFLCWSLTSCEPVLNMMGMAPDGPLEEFTEEVIRLNTGIDTDLSPMTPEKR